jgi:hypothetical protein
MVRVSSSTSAAVVSTSNIEDTSSWRLPDWGKQSGWP